MGWFKRAVAIRLGLTFVVGCTAGAILAGSASAAVTIGSNLQHEPNQSSNCSDLNRCTLMLSALEPARQAPGGVVSPIDGVLVSWSIRVAAPSEPITFRVIRPSGPAGSFIGAGSLPEVTPPEYATTAYPARVAVRAGDRIGIDCCQMGNARLWNDAGFNPGGESFFAPNGSTFHFWNPILPDGGLPLPPTFTQSPEQYETAIQARIEPDCDHDGLFDETQDSNLSSCAPGTIPPPAPTPPGAAPATCNPATIIGTDGNDARTGSQGKDVIVALGGNDTLSGIAGNDVVCGGSGNDELNGGKGKDALLGQQGKDKLKGKNGNDTLRGGKGIDTLKGGGGKDVCKGGKGRDIASGCEVQKSI